MLINNTWKAEVYGGLKKTYAGKLFIKLCLVNRKINSNLKKQIINNTLNIMNL